MTAEPEFELLRLRLSPPPPAAACEGEREGAGGGGGFGGDEVAWLLIVGSDGLWDVMSEREVFSTITRGLDRCVDRRSGGGAAAGSGDDRATSEDDDDSDDEGGNDDDDDADADADSRAEGDAAVGTDASRSKAASSSSSGEAAAVLRAMRRALHGLVAEVGRIRSGRRSLVRGLVVASRQDGPLVVHHLHSPIHRTAAETRPPRAAAHPYLGPARRGTTALVGRGAMAVTKQTRWRMHKQHTQVVHRAMNRHASRWSSNSLSRSATL